MTGCLSLLCFMVFGPPGVALDGTGPAAAPIAATSVQAFGRTSTCDSWTDGCVVCQRRDGQPAACSTPGIACTPGPIACRPTQP